MELIKPARARKAWAFSFLVAVPVVDGLDAPHFMSQHPLR